MHDTGKVRACICIFFFKQLYSEMVKKSNVISFTLMTKQIRTTSLVSGPDNNIMLCYRMIAVK